MRIKICGITVPEDVRFISSAGADAIGLNFFSKSPRYVDPRKSAEILREFDPFLAPVGVFVDTPMRQACAIAFQLGLRHTKL